MTSPLHGGRRWRTLRLAILERRIMVDGHGCWLTSADPQRYDRVWIEGRPVPTHRAVYSLFHDDVCLDSEMHVHHKCTVPACVNPEHLVLLTRVEHKATHRELDKHLRRKSA